ncbi:MAG: efflux RND transporter periplasmic adaptor subunit [Planctomycetes bacterium]|nr:efflux RND transporter periplasmic adaptor subunit [Planctomycetota bacterium]
MAKPARNRRVRGIIIAAVAILLIGGGAILYRMRGSGGARAPELPWTVKPMDLEITVEEGGNLKAARSVELSCKIEAKGGTTIIFLVPEGTHVKEGDLLVRFDSAEFMELRAQRLISVEGALASLRYAEEALEIQRNQNESNINQARLTMEFAEIDLVKYLTGDWPQEQRKALAQIKIDRAELMQSETQLQWTRELAKKGYVAATDLEKDTLNRDRSHLGVENSESALNLLERYTFPKQMKKYVADYREAKLDYQRVLRKCNALIAQAEAELRAKRTTYDLEKERLDKLDYQIKNSEIRAPQDGLVVYARQDDHFRRENRIIEEGATVYERQPIITLPDVSEMIANVQIHESEIDRVEIGQPARIVIEAFPDRVYTGKVNRVGLLPDSVNRWLNPDLMVYNTEVKLDSITPDVRPGMSAQITIIVEKIPNALCVPVQSIVAEGTSRFVYVWRDGRAEKRRIETGKFNDSFSQVLSGVTEGELVLLSPPTTEADRKAGKEEPGPVEPENGQPLAGPGAESSGGAAQGPDVGPGGGEGGAGPGRGAPGAPGGRGSFAGAGKGAMPRVPGAGGPGGGQGFGPRTPRPGRASGGEGAVPRAPGAGGSGPAAADSGSGASRGSGRTPRASRASGGSGGTPRE